MDKIDALLEQKPFELSRKEKEKVFLEAIKEAIIFHKNNSNDFRKIAETYNFKVENDFRLEDIPYLPVSIFKKMKLLSVPESEIATKVVSSSTSGNTPSSIYLDKITIKRQVKSLNSILSSFISSKRKVFIIFDTQKTINTRDKELSSRGSAIRGMLPFSKSMHFVLDDDLNLDNEKLEEALKGAEGEEICFFGFTWLLHKIASENLGLDLKSGNVLHIGGWKKLQDLKVSKEEFNDKISKIFKTKDIRDIYGMTEQLGTIYIDCEAGFKHIPLYSEIIMRDIETFESAKEGFIQLVSPIPHSYPGISLLSDDIGTIIGEDDCKCGRKGKYFLFKERSKKAELKGCGDTLR